MIPEEYRWLDEFGEPAPEGSSKHCAVYFLLDEEENALKVGSAHNVQQRLCELQVGNSRKLTYIGWIPGDLDKERSIQAAMGEQHIKGEWYRMTPEILSFVRSACAEQRKRLEAARIRLVAMFELHKNETLVEVNKKRGTAFARLISSARPLTEALKSSLEAIRANRG